MKHVFISDDIGTPIYFDHPDGRMMCMPVATTHDMMAANFGEEVFSAISCGPLRIIFQRVAGGTINLALVSDEGESDGFLKGQLRLIFDILLLLFGPRTLAPPHVRRFNFLRHRDAVSTVVDTMLWLAAHQQSFLVESIELVDVNAFIRGQCVEALRVALEDVPHAHHAILFAGTKLIASYTKRSASGPKVLSNHDVFLLMLYMMGQFHGRGRALDETALPIADYTDHARAFRERDRAAREVADATGVELRAPVGSAQLIGSDSGIAGHAGGGVSGDAGPSSVSSHGIDSDDGFESALDDLPTGLSAFESVMPVGGVDMRVVEEIVSIACNGKVFVEPLEETAQLELRQAAGAVQAALGSLRSRMRHSSPDAATVLRWCQNINDDESALRRETVDSLLQLVQQGAQRGPVSISTGTVDFSVLDMLLADAETTALDRISGVALAALLVRAGEHLLHASPAAHLPFQRTRGMSSPVVPTSAAFSAANSTSAAVLGSSISSQGTRLRHLASTTGETAGGQPGPFESLENGSSDNLTDDGIASDTLDQLNLTDEDGNTSASSTSNSEGDTLRSDSLYGDQANPEDPPKEPVFNALYLRTGNGGTTLASNWCYFGEVQDPICLVIVNEASTLRSGGQDGAVPDGCIGSQEEQDELAEKQVAIQRALVNYLDYLVTKERAHMSILSYLHQLPGLIHFIFVDRTAKRVLAPTIGPLHGSECAAAFGDAGEGENASERMKRLLQQEVWQMCYLANRYLSQGFCSMSVRAGNFRYNYRLWLEDSKGKEVHISQNIASLERENGDVYNALVEATPRAARCYELYTLFISLVPSHLIYEYEKKLVSLVKPTS